MNLIEMENSFSFFSFRRMFPHCSIALTGLQPLTDYVIMVDMIPVDGFKYKVGS